MQERDPIGKVQRHVHVVLDHDDRYVARDRGEQLPHIAALVYRKTCKRLIQKQNLRVLRHRHGDLDPSPLTIGCLGQRPIGGVVEPDKGQGLLGARRKMALALEADYRIPAQSRQAEQRQLDIAQNRIAREQRDDLVGAGQAEMGAAPAWGARDVLSEQQNRAGIRCEFSGYQVKQRGLARTVGTDDEAALTGLDRKVDAFGDAKAAERFRQARDGERCHGGAPRTCLRAGLRASQRCRAKPQIRTEPGTSPSGMKLMMATKMTPSTRFQRTMYALTTFFMMTTMAAPAIGPNKVAVPPEITMSRTSAEDVSAATCGLMNWL